MLDLLSSTVLSLGSTNLCVGMASFLTAGCLLAEGTEAPSLRSEAFECGAVGSDGWIVDVVEIRTSLLAAIVFELELWALLSSVEDSWRTAACASCVVLTYTSFSCVEVAA